MIVKDYRLCPKSCKWHHQTWLWLGRNHLPYAQTLESPCTYWRIRTSGKDLCLQINPSRNAVSTYLNCLETWASLFPLLEYYRCRYQTLRVITHFTHWRSCNTYKYIEPLYSHVPAYTYIPGDEGWISTIQYFKYTSTSVAVGVSVNASGRFIYEYGAILCLYLYAAYSIDLPEYMCVCYIPGNRYIYMIIKV